MTKVTQGMGGTLPEKPSSVIRYRGEYFISGTERHIYNYKDNTKKKNNWNNNDQAQEFQDTDKKVIVVVCDDSGYAATPYCPNATEKILSDNAPQANYFCPVHNPDKEVYPTQ